MAWFSQRTGWELESNEFALAVELARAAKRELLDLTVSNPTRCGFTYPAEWFACAGEAVACYEPASRGATSAIAAVADYYYAMDVRVAAEQVVLTSSTSEAYSYLFRLLCDAGDEVLAARPSYPLFDFLAGLDDVRLVDYPLFYDYGWHIDLAELERKINPRTRAIVVVHPNNPTGNYVQERAALEEICRRHGLALIVDEVFLDFGFSNEYVRSFGVHSASFANGSEGLLSFVLSGISKVCALPQMKLSWIVANGPQDVLEQAMARLEVIADTFLSVSTPAQLSLPVWLRGREAIQQQIRERMAVNLATLRNVGLEVLQLEGGWTAVLRFSRWREAIERGVLVQPGSFYGLGDPRAVVSLITPEETMAAGARLLAELQ